MSKRATTRHHSGSAVGRFPLGRDGRLVITPLSISQLKESHLPEARPRPALDTVREQFRHRLATGQLCYGEAQFYRCLGLLMLTTTKLVSDRHLAPGSPACDVYFLTSKLWRGLGGVLPDADRDLGQAAKHLAGLLGDPIHPNRQYVTRPELAGQAKLHGRSMCEEQRVRVAAALFLPDVVLRLHEIARTRTIDQINRGAFRKLRSPVGEALTTDLCGRGVRRKLEQRTVSLSGSSSSREADDITYGFRFLSDKDPKAQCPEELIGDDRQASPLDSLIAAEEARRTKAVYLALRSCTRGKMRQLVELIFDNPDAINKDLACVLGVPSPKTISVMRHRLKRRADAIRAQLAV